MNTYKIKFYELIGKVSEIEIDANSQEEAKKLFWDELNVNVSLSDLICKDVLSTDIEDVICIYEDLEEIKEEEEE